MVWLYLFIPLIAIIIILLFYTKRIAWFEPVIMFGVVIVIILIAKFAVEKTMTDDVEYYQSFITKVEYYETWDEYIYERCVRTCCCNSDGQNCSTETYDCSYIDNHPEYWLITTNTGKTIKCTKSEYLKLVNKFDVKPVFIDLKRNYYLIDGNKYVCEFNGDFNKLEYLTWKHHYENRIQASHTILKTEPVDAELIKKYDLVEYPTINNYKAKSILGENNTLDNYVNMKNSLIGKSKQVKVFYIIFHDQPQLAALKQEQHWLRGNKNEVNICISIDKDRNVQWAYVFGWSKEKIVNIEIENYIEDQKRLDDKTFKTIIDYSHNTIKEKFKRRQFEEFSYLTVEPNFNAHMWILLIVTVITIGMSIWIVKNNLNMKH